MNRLWCVDIIDFHDTTVVVVAKQTLNNNLSKSKINNVVLKQNNTADAGQNIGQENSLCIKFFLSHVLIMPGRVGDGIERFDIFKFRQIVYWTCLFSFIFWDPGAFFNRYPERRLY